MRRIFFLIRDFCFLMLLFSYPQALLKSPGSEISLCNLCVLCVSVVYFCSEIINHRDTENTEVAQRREISGLLGQSRTRILGTLASVDQSYPKCEQEHGEGWRQYAEGLHTKLIEIACGSEHISEAWFRFLQPNAKV